MGKCRNADNENNDDDHDANGDCLMSVNLGF